MKTILLILPMLFAGAASTAQGVFSNQTNFMLEKVVQDYPSQFKNIRGKLIASAPASAKYASILTIPGAVSTTIIESKQAEKAVVCWQSVLYVNADFSTTKDRFESLFEQIKNTIIKPLGEKPVIVNGLFINPAQDKIFTTIQFDLLPPVSAVQKVNIDLVMQQTGGQWQVVLNVYDNERTADAGGIVVK
jgi:hypothetical protein